MHEQEVRLVVLAADVLRDAGGHGYCGDACRADEGIDPAAGGAVHDNAAEQAADGGDTESEQAEEYYLYRIPVEEVLSDHGGADGGCEENGNDVHQRVLSRVGKSVGDAALTEEVAQHQAADEGSRRGQEQDDEGSDHDGEDYLLGLGDLAGLLHLYLAHLVGGEKLHKRRLDHGDQRHV